MDPERQRIQDDLRGLVRGDVRCDDVAVQLYASDASIYEIRPLGVVRPRSTADVVACVRYAAEKRLAVHARGAGTGLAGESLGRGLVFDFSRYMRRDHPHRRRMGPRAAGHGACGIESALAGQGANIWARPGDEPGDDDGERRGDRRLGKPLAPVRIRAAARAEPASGAGRWHGTGGRPRADSPRGLGEPVVAAAGGGGAAGGAARAECPVDRRATAESPGSRSGYQLADVLEGGSLHLGRLFTGSEGTLAMMTEATLATTPLPKARGIGSAVLRFARGGRTSGARDPAFLALRVRPLGPPAFEPGARQLSRIQSADSGRGRSAAAGRASGGRSGGGPRANHADGRSRAAEQAAGVRFAAGVRSARRSSFIGNWLVAWRRRCIA